MRVLGPSQPDAEGDGFDRRDFAPPGTRFPATRGPEPAPQRRSTAARPRSSSWVRYSLIAGGALLLVLLLGITVVQLLRPDPIVAVGSVVPSADDVATTGGGASTAPTASGAGTASAAIDRMIPQELNGAAAFAVQFANSYLNYDEAIPEVRAQALTAYLAPDLDPQLGWSGSGRQLAVMTLALDAEARPDGRTAVTVAAQVTGQQAPRWVYLSVPLAQDERGRWAVVGSPAFLARPQPGRPEATVEPEVDTQLTVELQEPVAALFASYGSADVVQVNGVTAPSADIRGLAGQYTFLRIADLRVFSGEGTERTAVADVVWDNELTGGSVQQRYQLTLVDGGDVWLIDAVAGG